MTALEAMAQGVPVVLSEGCHLPEAEEAGAGRVVSLDRFGEAVRELLGRDTSALRENAARLVRERFAIAKILDAYEHLYQDLARG